MKAYLLFNGGVCTYIKDREESNFEVADHANDNVRINADELNVLIVGEGGNLGFTQKARVTFALRGGRINTDSLDNSAGVDTSDHEVNLKILLNNMESLNIINSEKKYEIIKTTTPDIVRNVLKDNYEQNLIISLDLIRAKRSVLDFENTLNILTNNKILNVNQEKLFFIKENRLPVRPELCVLLGYTKIFLQHSILNDIKIEDSYLKEIYFSYFPEKLIKSYKDSILEHQLAKNIAATTLVNEVINQAGIAFFFTLPGEKGHDYYNNIYNYYRAFKLMNIDKLWEFLEYCENINVNDKYSLLIFLTDVLKCILIYNSYSKREVFFNEFKTFEKVLEAVSVTSKDDLNANIYNNIISHFPADIKKSFMSLFKVNEALDIFDIVVRFNIHINTAIKLYNVVEELFHMKNCLQCLSNIPVKSHWDFENLMLLNYKFKEFHKNLVKKLSLKEKKDPYQIMKLDYPEYEKFIKFFDDLLNSSLKDFSPFNVLIEELNLYFNQ
jgi:glutamate dehydrogenase